MSDALRAFKESAASTAQAVSENLNVNKCIYQRLLLWWKKTRPKLPAVSAPFTLFRKQKKSSGQRNSPNRETAVYLAGTIRTMIMCVLRLLKHLHIIDGCFSHLAVVLGAGFKAIPLGGISIYPDVRTNSVREVFAVRLLLSEKLHQFDADGVNCNASAGSDHIR